MQIRDAILHTTLSFTKGIMWLEYIHICMCMKMTQLQLGKLKENCSRLKLYRKLRKMFLSPRPESNPQPSDIHIYGQNIFIYNEVTMLH